MRIRELEPADREPVLAMNNAAVPSVNELTAAGLDALIERSRLALVADFDATVGGLVVLVGAGTDYDSDNYRWFDARYADFCYLDRIVVDSRHRGAGIGAALHGAVEEHARRSGTPMIALEVNLDPPNPGSLRFHERLGFARVDTYRGGSGKLVSMMTRAVSPHAGTG